MTNDQAAHDAERRLAGGMYVVHSFPWNFDREDRCKWCGCSISQIQGARNGEYFGSTEPGAYKFDEHGEDHSVPGHVRVKCSAIYGDARPK